jgi:hypothetical protein
MDLLVTASAYPKVYKVQGNQIERYHFEDFSQHEIGQPTWDLNVRLPWEILSKIIYYLFYAYLKDHNYDLAGALTAINKAFAREIYQDIYKVALIPVVKKIQRVCNTLYTLERIHDDYLTMVKQTKYSYCRLIKTYAEVGGHYRPWSFTLDCFAVPSHGVLAYDDDETVHNFSLGALYGETLWMNGYFSTSGLFKCRKMRHPIITLDICLYDDQTILTSSDLQTNVHFKMFINLIKKCYGPNTGIYVMFNDDPTHNPFDISQRGFIEF